jgi:hypothetical protein
VVNLPLSRRGEFFAIVCLSGGRPDLLRHPADGGIVAFRSAAEAFRFSVSLEVCGEACTGTIAAPAGEPLHMVTAASAAVELLGAPAVAA